MVTFNRLNADPDITGSDQVPVYDSGSNRLRKGTMTQIAEFVRTSLGLANELVEEAPDDNFIYGRQNKSWVTINKDDAGRVVPLIAPRQTGDGVKLEFDSPVDYAADPRGFFVQVDGITQRPTSPNSVADYSINGNGKVIFTEAVPDGALVDIRFFQPSTEATDRTQDTVIANGSTTARTLGSRFADVLNVKDFGAVGDGVADDTAAIQAAFDATSAGSKLLCIPSGVYMCKQINVPATFSGGEVFGVGSKHPSSVSGAELRSIDGSFESIFETQDGCDGIIVRSIVFNGNDVGRKGVKVKGGAIHHYVNCSFNNFLEYGFESFQGLTHLTGCRAEGNTGYGVAVYSDSSIVNCEFTGGTTPLWLKAGGNRVVNLWANAGSASNVLIKPYDASTNHINTSLTNIYVGELTTSNGSAVVDIQATGASKPRQVQLSNSHIVIASGNQLTRGIKMDSAEDIVISNLAVLGFISYWAPTRQALDFIWAANTTALTVTGCIFNGATRNSVYLGSGNIDVQFSGCIFKDWGYDTTVPSHNACIYAEDAGNTNLNIDNCVFRIQHGSASAVAGSFARGEKVIVTNCRVSMPNATPFVSRDKSVIHGEYYTSTGKHLFVPVAYTNDGVVASGGGSTVTLTTLPTAASNKQYEIFVSQQGSGSNSCKSTIFTFNTTAGVLPTQNTNTVSVLLNTISVTGLEVKMDVGTGYGVTSWAWSVREVL